jgi:DNA-binding PadR family transcriptional regulator
MWIDILVLGHLLQRPAHGYEIKQRVGRSIGSAQPLNNNVLYPALRRLEELGAVESELQPKAASPPRRVYRLTERGVELLRGMVEDLPADSALDEGEFNVRLAYFELVEPAARLQILRTRAAASRALLDHLRRSLEDVRQESRHPYAGRLLEFLVSRQEADVRFVEDLARDVAGPEQPS